MKSFFLKGLLDASAGFFLVLDTRLLNNFLEVYSSVNAALYLINKNDSLGLKFGSMIL